MKLKNIKYRILQLITKYVVDCHMMFIRRKCITRIDETIHNRMYNWLQLCMFKSKLLKLLNSFNGIVNNLQKFFSLGVI